MAYTSHQKVLNMNSKKQVSNYLAQTLPKQDTRPFSSTDMMDSSRGPSVQNLSLPVHQSTTINTARSKTSQRSLQSKNSCDIKSLDDKDKDSVLNYLEINSSSKKVPNHTPLLHDKNKKKLRGTSQKKKAQGNSKKKDSSNSKKREQEPITKTQSFKLANKVKDLHSNFGVKTERKTANTLRNSLVNSKPPPSPRRSS